jgi:hypothetical protein
MKPVGAKKAAKLLLPKRPIATATPDQKAITDYLLARRDKRLTPH